MPLTLLLLLAGCASPYGDLSSRLPKDTPARILALEAQGFTLAAAEHSDTHTPKAEGGRVTILIEGDGRPWVAGGRRISDNPTPHHTPMLEAFLDTSPPALYLGRPCYFGMGPAEQCSAALWTFSRYSHRVVDAMVEAARRWLASQPPDTGVTLMGHSGGGVLALLIGERLRAVDRVITYAAPVDIRRWSELHGFTPLFDSINPADINTWRSDVSRLLIFGEQDAEVPPGVFTPTARRIPGARLVIVPEADHLPPADLSVIEAATQ